MQPRFVASFAVQLVAVRVLGLAILLVLAAQATLAEQEVHTDVCVYGGTSGGVIAAVQAARMGKSVALVVVNNHLGGMTSGGLGQTDLGSYGDTYIQGVAREFYGRIGQKYSTGAKFTFEPHVAEAVFNEMVSEAPRVRVWTNQVLADVTMQEGRLRAIRTQTGDLFRAAMFIDASYEGDLMARAGVSCTLGREAVTQYGESLNGVRTPNTGGHQFGTLKVDPYVTAGDSSSGLLPLIQSGSPGAPGSADQRMQAYNFRMCLTQTATNRLPITAPADYDPARYELLARYIQALVAQGSSPSLGSFMNVGVMPNGKTDINNNGAVSTDFIGQNYDYPEADPAARAQIWQAHRDYIQGLFFFLATDMRVPSSVRSAMGAYGLCKDEFLDTGGWPHQLYVREARRMVSDYVMTQFNCSGQAVAPGSVGLGVYTMDSHNCQRVVVNGVVQNEGDVQVGTAGPYPIAYLSVVPRSGECRNLLVPWSLSASHMAFGSIRMEPVFMILGQSAATAACLALDDGVAVQELDLYRLQAQLTADKQALGSSSGFNPDLGIVLDNADPSDVSIVGTWSNSTSTAGYYGRDYLHDGNTSKGLSSVTFTPTLTNGGAYHVFARWTAHANRGTNVPIDVIHPAGTNTIIVNQTQQGGTWVWLLTTNFNPGTTGKVRIRNTGTTGYVIADAVQFVSVTNETVVNLWATDASASRFGLEPASFTVSRAGNTNVPLTVRLEFAGSGVAGADFLPIPAAITFPPGVLFSNLLVIPTVRSMPVGDKTVQVRLAADPLYSAGRLSSAVLTIEDLPFFQWQVTHFGADATNSAIAGERANASGDGIPNLVKYALGLDPLTAATNTLAFAGLDDSGRLLLSYTRPDPSPADLEYAFDSSPDLVAWCSAPTCVEVSRVTLNTNSTATITGRAALPATSTDKLFLRLRVSRLLP